MFTSETQSGITAESKAGGYSHDERYADIHGVTSVCFRVTRACNLHCSYCQAPPNAKQLTVSELTNALNFLSEIGIERVKFTGGEPFVYKGILPLIEECRGLEMEPTIVTNGTLLPTGAENYLRRFRARLKISLHGPSDRHNALQGQAVYDAVITTMRTLIAAGIETSIHTLLHRGFHLNLTEWIEFLAGQGVHKVSFMTFVPRGRGSDFKDQWMFSDSELQDLCDQVNGLGRQYRESIIVRYLDFARKPYLVFETDGRLGWQVAEESGDWPVVQVPVRVVNNNAALTMIQNPGVTNLVNSGQAPLNVHERNCL